MTIPVGTQIQSSTGHWNPPPTVISYQWERSSDTPAIPNFLLLEDAVSNLLLEDGSSILQEQDFAQDGWSMIGAATRSDYIVQNADVGCYLRAAVVASNSIGDSATSYSDSAGPVGEATIAEVIVAPVISGSFVAGSVLTSTTGTWTQPAAYSYFWEDSPDNANWSALVDGPSNHYTVTQSSADRYIRVGVIATNQVGSSTVSYSAAGGPVPADVITVFFDVSVQTGGAQTANQMFALAFDPPSPGS